MPQNDPTAVLTAWHKLEHFTPAAVPKGKQVMLLEEPIWEQGTRPRQANWTYVYTVYLGVFSSEHVQDFVLKHFQVEESDENFRPSEICCASLKLDVKGHYVRDSLGISTLPWALHRLETGNLANNTWGPDFRQVEDELKSLCEPLFQRTLTDESGEMYTSLVVTLDQLASLESSIVRGCGWSAMPDVKSLWKRDEIRVANNPLPNDQDADLLNSFFVRDLERMLDQHAGTAERGAWHDYLRGVCGHQPEKEDAARDKALLQRTLSPLNYPNGCWPAGFVPSLMQQFAVTSMTSRLMFGGTQTDLLSVNGPPGTGKTTLLRDIVAPIIVQLASELVQIDSPAGGIQPAGSFANSGGTWTHHIARADVSRAGGGIVVASSNNGAVENISKEIPLKQKLGPSYRDSAGYFKKVAQECIHPDHFGLVSAVLGNAKNRNQLFNALWWKDNALTLKILFETPDLEPIKPWGEVKKEFEMKLASVTKEKARLEGFRQNYEKFVAAERTHETATSDLSLASKALSTATNAESTAAVALLSAKEQKANSQQDVATTRLGKPGFFAYWFSGKKRRAYETALSSALEAFTLASKALELATATQHSTQTRLKAAESAQREASLKLDEAVRELSHRRTAAEAEKALLGASYADQAFWKHLDKLETQLHAPWYSEQLQTLQSELFLLALAVRESFIRTANLARGKIKSTLEGFFAYQRGDFTGPLAPGLVEAMWDTFFLVFPVVSTTFASVQTMFKDLGPGSIPWLFIDEAGQATPAAAAGAIWRAQRVVVVGDPMQIEPVVTIPAAVTENIGKHFEVDSQSLGIGYSVQTMADRINPLGTTLYLDDGTKRTVGIPLRVHRRCDSPMFNISNEIAYGGLMLQATQHSSTPKVQLATQFIDCRGEVDGRQFVPAQARVVERLILDEITRLGDLPDLYVITPFTEVGWKLRQQLYYSIARCLQQRRPALDGEVSEWINSHIGTVHTFQGKEAEGVILCLGLDLTKTGAANWASSTPNLLNVAVTRAKRRLVVVGDSRLWLERRYFAKLARLDLAQPHP